MTSVSIAGDPKKVETKDAEGKTSIKFETTTETHVTGDFDAMDAIHIVPLDEVEMVDLEGDPAKEQAEAPIRPIRGGKGK